VCQHLDFDVLDELLRDQDFRCFVRRHREEELARMSTVLLGYCYEKGLYDSEDFEQNFEKAYWLYHSAALQGQMRGIYFFARLYAFGRGVMLNHEFAAMLLIAHSEQSKTLADKQILCLLAYLSHFVPQAWHFVCKHIASIKN
jgi:TPR repeat protein